MRPNILVVDDAGAIRKVLRRVLEGAGYHVSEAEDADEALRRLGRGHIDVVLTDVHMPGASGFELARLVQNLFPAIKVMVMSSIENAHFRQLPRELGIDAALSKPMSPEVLVGAVRAALAQAN
jgi:two-component system response regulator PilR (NtrC family)